MTTTKHSRQITAEGEGEDREYAASCSCATTYVSRLATYADALKACDAHKAAVADGTWQAEQDAEATRLADLAPLHDAQRARFVAQKKVRSCGFAVLIAKQHGGDVEAARADLTAARAILAAAEAALDAFRGVTA